MPVQVPPCQMLKTETPVSAYQLRRMLRELPRTSKKTSPSRGSGAASDADMLLIVALLPSLVQFVTKTLQQASCRPELRQGISPARMRDRTTDGIIIDGHAAACAMV